MSRIFFTPKMSLFDLITWMPISLALFGLGHWAIALLVTMTGAAISNACERHFGIGHRP